MFMKKIPLTQGKFAIVDDEDFEFLSQWKWWTLKSGNTFYAIRRSKNATILMHRVIIGAKPKKTVDHVNGNGLDNRKENIREVSNSENAMNRTLNSNNSSGTTGVSFHKKSKKFRATITVNKKSIHLGTFSSIEEAVIARKSAENKYFCNFTRQNY